MLMSHVASLHPDPTSLQRYKYSPSSTCPDIPASPSYICVHPFTLPLPATNDRYYPPILLITLASVFALNHNRAATTGKIASTEQCAERAPGIEGNG